MLEIRNIDLKRERCQYHTESVEQRLLGRNVKAEVGGRWNRARLVRLETSRSDNRYVVGYIISEWTVLKTVFSYSVWNHYFGKNSW